MSQAKRRALAEIARLLPPLPPGQRERNLETLARMVSPEALQEVRALLAAGSPDWERRYPPSPFVADLASEVLVACVAGLLRVACRPHPEAV